MSKAKTYFVYLHRSPSDRVYIGLTNQHPVHKRWNRRDPYRHNQYFTSAIEKYGWENFQHEILCEGLTATGIREAGATLGIKSGHISSCCKGERKTIGGYKWRYAND